jgi:hypothetical protein
LIAWRAWWGLRPKTRVVAVLVALALFAILGRSCEGPLSHSRGGANWEYSGGTTTDEFSGGRSTSHSARCRSVHAKSGDVGDRDNESLEIELETVDETGRYPYTQINLRLDGDDFFGGLPIEVRWDDGPVESFSLHTSEERFPNSVELGNAGRDGTIERFLDGLRKSKTVRIRVTTRILASRDIFTFNVAGLIWEHPP